MMGCEIGLFKINYKAMNSPLTDGFFLFVGVYCVNFCMRQRKEPIPGREWVASLFNRLKTQEA